MGVDQAGNCQRTEHEQCNQVHTDHFADKKYQRDNQYAQDERDLERHAIYSSVPKIQKQVQLVLYTT